MSGNSSLRSPRPGLAQRLAEYEHFGHPQPLTLSRIMAFHEPCVPHIQDADFLLPGAKDLGSSSERLPGSSSFTRSGYCAAMDWHTQTLCPAAVRAIRARCATFNRCSPRGMQGTAMLAGVATLPCGNIVWACCHGVWGSILVSFIHPLLHQVRPLFCKSPTFSGGQPPTWTAHPGDQKHYGKTQHFVFHGAPDGSVIPLLLQIWLLSNKDVTASAGWGSHLDSTLLRHILKGRQCTAKTARCTPHVLTLMKFWQDLILHQSIQLHVWCSSSSLKFAVRNDPASMESWERQEASTTICLIVLANCSMCRS